MKTIPPDFYQILLAVIELGRRVDDFNELQHWLDILERDLAQMKVQ